MPLGVSAMRRVIALHPLSETPLVVTAPMRDTSTKSEYSRPAANVPEPGRSGIGHDEPAQITLEIQRHYHATSFALKTGPSTQERFLPATVSTTHERHAPTPHAMRFSMEIQHGTCASSAMPATRRASRAQGPQQYTASYSPPRRKRFAHRLGAKTRESDRAVMGRPESVQPSEELRVIGARDQHGFG